MAAGNALTPAAVNQQIAQDATLLYSMYREIKERYLIWITNAGNQSQLNTLGITVAGDQNQIFALQLDMKRLIDVFEGTVVTAPGIGPNILQDIAFVRGVN